MQSLAQSHAPRRDSRRGHGALFIFSRIWLNGRLQLYASLYNKTLGSCLLAGVCGGGGGSTAGGSVTGRKELHNIMVSFSAYNVFIPIVLEIQTM